MLVSDHGRAELYLRRIGYYRLSGYWYPFRTTVPGTRAGELIVTDLFRTGTEFRHAVELYLFDKQLRLIFLDAIERIEVSLRVEIAQLLGSRNPWAHLQPGELHGGFVAKVNPSTGKTEYDIWMDQFKKVINRSREDFVIHFTGKYSGPLPIWIANELWEFGMLSKFLSGMRAVDQESIMKSYKVPRRDLIISWIRGINYVRNLCAHHCRLWNRSVIDQPKPPKSGELATLDHLATNIFSQSRLYGVAAPIQFLLRTINPTSQWKERLKKHFATFPSAPGIKKSQTGFPDGWEILDLWN